MTSRRAVVALLSLVMGAVSLVLAPEVAVQPSTAAINAPVLRSGPVLFVGTHRIKKMTNVRRLYHPGRKISLPGLARGQIRVEPVREYLGTNDAIDGDVDADGRAAIFKDATVLVEQVDGRTLYRMWFGSGYDVGYRESDDGRNWRIRDADSVVVTTNVVNPSVMKDSVTGRYVMTGWDRHKREYLERISDDGIRWRPSAGFAGPLSLLAGDVISANRDTRTGRLHAVAKDKSSKGPKCASNPPTYAGGRTFSQHTSYGARRTWYRSTTRLASDCIDARSATPLNRDRTKKHPYGADTPVHMYGMPFHRYGDQLLGFPWIYRIMSLGDTPEETVKGYSDGPIDTQIAVAQSFGRGWQRAEKRRPRVGARWTRPVLIQRGPTGSWDNGMIFGHAPLVIRGNQIAMYYTGYNTGHKPVAGVTQARLGMVTWERDRMVGLKAVDSSRVARVLTRPFRLPSGARGRSLYVNAKLPARGVIRAQVLDARTGKPISGYTLTRSRTHQGNQFAARIDWGGREIGALGTRPLQIDFRFTRGTFYSFSVR